MNFAFKKKGKKKASKKDIIKIKLLPCQLKTFFKVNF